MPRPLHPSAWQNMDSSICSSTPISRDASLSQSAERHSELGDTAVNTAIAGEVAAFEADSVANLAQSVKRELEEGEDDVISQDDERSQGEADMDICEESEDAAELEEEEGETKDGINIATKEEEIGGMESGPTSSEIPVPSKLQRFYFESDTLALKNNPE